MPRMPSAQAVPTFNGDVTKSKVTISVSPSFDDDFDVRPHRVGPFDDVPAFDNSADVAVVRTKPPEPSFDSDAEVSIFRAPST